jgi:aquaporin Z
MKTTRIAVAEAIGTFVLVLGGPGSAVLATGRFTPGSTIQVLGVSIAFGLTLLTMAYAIGNISGCHINPAVTLGLWLTHKLETALVPVYMGAQLVGAAAGGFVIWVIASGAPGNFNPSPGNFAVNGWSSLSPGGFNFGAMVAVEIVFTAVLVFVVLSTTHRKFSPAAGGLAVGLTLTLIHLVSIPVDNTSVNPARSFGMAIFAGGTAMEQLWAFIVFPLIGGVLGVLAWRAVDDSADEAEEVLGPTKLVDVLDAVKDGGGSSRPTGAQPAAPTGDGGTAQ